MVRPTVKIIAVLAAASFTLSSPAAAAVQSQSSQAALMSPWVALSALGSTSSGAALCANVAAAAAAGQVGTVGCVLPQVDAPVAAPVAEAVPAPLPVAAAAPVAGGGFGFLPILLGLAAVAAGVALLAGKGNNNSTINLPPLSPS
ncbi:MULTISPECIES: hypothetical protein [Sphingomonas]|uniref:hypothetical protein n=1 Tax=Sphingomonas TaxID=13687 RepID=UPI00126A5012|nr:MULTISPECIES: hypothetical protein [Sphingomonas]